MTSRPLGVGFIGSGFIARFHIRSWEGVREADVRGVWSPNAARAREAAALARELRVGDREAVRLDRGDGGGPGDRLHLAVRPEPRADREPRAGPAARERGAELRGIAIEKPLARNVAEAKRAVELLDRIGCPNGYLEDQLFTPALQRGRAIVWARGAALAGRPYLARAAEEHSGPHMPWFWRGDLQGGGVLTDMMCHSIEVCRFLLTRPGAPRHSIRPTKVSAQIASLKWSRPEYADLLKRDDGPGGRPPAEADRGLRPREHPLRRRGGNAAAGRGDDELELRRRRPAAQRRAARPGVLAVRELARQRRARLLQPPADGRGRRGPASRSRTPSRG